MTVPGRALLAEFAAIGATDATCFLGQWPYRLGAAADAEGLRIHAGRLGLRSLWVSHLAALFGFDTRTGNEAVHDACAGDDLFRVFATIDSGQPDWRAELDWAAAAGFSGIRLAPGFHRHPLSETGPIIEAAASHRLPVQLLVRLDDARVRHPLSPAVDLEPQGIADLVRAHAGHPLLVSGLNFAEWRELSRHLGDEAPPGLRLDLWHVNGPSHLDDTFAADSARWTFGSGFPVQAAEASALQLAAAALDGEHLRAIASDNAERILFGR